MRFIFKTFAGYCYIVLYFRGLLQLYNNLLQPTSGRITVAGEDLRTFDKSEWARVVSIVNQVIF